MARSGLPRALVTRLGAFDQRRDNRVPSSRDEASLGGITAGPDGALWFTEALDVNSIRRMTWMAPSRGFRSPNPTASHIDITMGLDGNLWFTEDGGNRIGRITPAGAITEFRLPTSPRGLLSIVAGPDGALWFTEEAAIGRLSVTGAYTEFPLSSESGPDNITSGT